MKKGTKPENLRLLEKEIITAGCKILFNEKITTGNIDSLFEIHNSRWTVEDGWFTGINNDESAGTAILRQDFPGDIILSFEGRTILPSTHDINFMWNGEWSEELNSCRNAYIGSICGWHRQRAGIEKPPDYRFRVTVPNDGFIPGRTYKIIAGSADGTCFLFIDGKLVLEADDPDPLDTQKFLKVAFTAWSSHIQIRDITIRQVNWIERTEIYKPEF